MDGLGWTDKVPLRGTDGEYAKISSVAESTILEALLTANGIECEVSGLPRGFHQLPAHILLVASEQVEPAMKIIAEAQEAGESAAEEAELAGELAGDRPPDGSNSGTSGLL